MPALRGLHLLGWYAASSRLGLRPTAVLLHGRGGNAANLLTAALALQSAGYAVLLMEAHNHGSSDHGGHSSLTQFAQDLNSAIGWLAARPGPAWMQVRWWHWVICWAWRLRCRQHRGEVFWRRRSAFPVLPAVSQ